MSDYDQLRDATRLLENLRNSLVGKIEVTKGAQRDVVELHQRVSKALMALSDRG